MSNLEKFSPEEDKPDIIEPEIIEKPITIERRRPHSPRRTKLTPKPRKKVKLPTKNLSEEHIYELLTNTSTEEKTRKISESLKHPDLTREELWALLNVIQIHPNYTPKQKRNKVLERLSPSSLEILIYKRGKLKLSQTLYMDIQRDIDLKPKDLSKLEKLVHQHPNWKYPQSESIIGEWVNGYTEFPPTNKNMIKEDLATNQIVKWIETEDMTEDEVAAVYEAAIDRRNVRTQDYQSLKGYRQKSKEFYKKAFLGNFKLTESLAHFVTTLHLSKKALEEIENACLEKLEQLKKK
jgi:hypothetical protein